MITIEELTVTFGGVRAVDGVSLEIGDGIVFGLIGPNGSGKSTMLNALSGVVPATGRVALDGVPLRLGRPRDVWRRGVARTFQTPQPYGEITCVENVMLAMPDRRLTGLCGAWTRRLSMLRHEHRRWDVAYAALDSVGLGEVADEMASTLSYGRRRFLEMARVVAMDPSIVLLDEPAAGLNDRETQQLIDFINSIRGRGATVVVVEHKIDFLNAACDQVAVLNQGKIIAAGTPREVWNDPAVATAYLGLV